MWLLTNWDQRFISTHTHPSLYANIENSGLVKKWFIDAGAAVGVGTYGNGVVTMSTTHGYQFNPYFYAGAGLALEYHTGWEKVFVPIYINGRVNFMTSRVTPFFNMKLGYSAFDGSGFYMSPSAGVTISFSQKLALNVGLGYNMQMAEFQSLGGYSGRYYRVTRLSVESFSKSESNSKQRVF